MRKKIEIPIMFCFDKNYVIPASVAFYSLLEHANKNYFYHLFVLHSDISEYHQNKLRKTIEIFSEYCKLEFIDMDNRFIDIWNELPKGTHYSKEVLYKLLLPSIFPQYDKMIVSDVDVVFLGDISKSYTDTLMKKGDCLLSVKQIGALKDYLHVYEKEWTSDEIEKLGLMCGGYLVMNLGEMRKSNMEQICINYLKNNTYRLNQFEQDVINICFADKCSFLPLNYVTCTYCWDYYKTEEDMENDSVFTKEEIIDAMEHPIQLHYATNIKPWKNVGCAKSEEWFKYIVKTPFLNEYLYNLSKIIESNSKKRIRKHGFIYNGLRYIKHNPLFLLKREFYHKINVRLKRKFRKSK